MTTRSPFAALPNAISVCRLLLMPVLLTAALKHRVSLFAWLLLAGLLSDIADGVIARRFHLESPLGATLDTTADLLLTLMAAVGMFTMQRAFVSAHTVELAVLIGLYGGEVAISFARYGRLSSFHTYAARICAYAQGIFFVSLFFWGYSAWLFYVAWTLGCLAYVEEWILLALLPAWTHDVRGVYWVMKGRAR